MVFFQGNEGSIKMTWMPNFSEEARAMQLCETRAQLIARNMANVNTPHYKAQDLNFQEAMASVQSSNVLQTTNTHHLAATGTVGGEKNYYRTPMQYKMDGNTVDEEIERKNFIENSLRYQSSLSFMQQQAAQLIKAIRGE